MPLKANAGYVRTKYNTDANARVDAAATSRLTQLEKAEQFLLRSLDSAVTGYFAAKDKGNVHPYPDQNRAIVSVLDQAFASGNDPDMKHAVTTLDARQIQLVTQRMQKELNDAGFHNQVAFDPAKGTLVVTLWDPQFQPLAKEHEAKRRFTAQLGEV